MSNSCMLFELAVGKMYLWLLRTALRVRPTESFADHVGDQSNGSSRGVGKRHIEKLIRCVGRITGREGVTLKLVCRLHQGYYIVLNIGLFRERRHRFIPPLARQRRPRACGIFSNDPVD